MRFAYSKRGAAALVVLSLSSVAACGKKAESAPTVRSTGESRPAVRVGAAPVQARTVPRTLRITGTLLADQQSNVTPIVPGRVTQVFVERGDVVAEGAPLIKLRDVDYRLQNASARAQYEQARTRLGVADGQRVNPDEVAEVRAARVSMEYANGSLERAERLLAQGALAQTERDRLYATALGLREQYQATLNNIRGAVAALDSARVAVEQSGNAVRDSIVRAPFAGEIAARLVNVGEYVAPQAPVATLVRIHPLRMEMLVPQEQMSSIQRGQQVEIHVDALPDRTFAGTVRYISASIQRDSRSLMVEAEVQNADGALRPGLFAEARIALADTQNLFEVPRTAVREEAGVARIFVIKEGQIDERVVTIVDRTGDNLMIRGTFAANEQVATSNIDALADGIRVTVQ